MNVERGNLKKAYSSKLIWVFYFIYYLLFFAVLNRELPNYLGTKDQWVVITLFSLYPILMATERLISRYIPTYIYLYFIMQLGITFWLLVIPNDPADQDYFMNLVLPLCGQAIWNLDVKIGKYCVVAFSLFCFITMVIYYPPSDGISFGLTYVAGCILVSVLSAATLQSITARQKTLELLEELKAANQKLKEYALQVERLAVAEERNRLARELHDSVTQIIFSLTLSAQAARILIDRDLSRAKTELDNMQGLAQNALAEMRTLIQELHPHSVTDEGLIPALRKLIAVRQENNGMTIELRLHGDYRFPENIEAELYRIVQEALSNVAKHSQADHAVVSLNSENKNRIILEIEDSGIGFDTKTLKSLPGHLGLTSMEERVRAIGGILAIDSQPGKGTRLKVEIAFKQEEENGR